MESNGNSMEGTGDHRPEKRRDHFINPWQKARGYQLEVFDMALYENIITFLETGTGKTLIAVLLLDALSHCIRKPSAQFAVFLVPNRHLVEQQARHIEEHSNLRVGRICGSEGKCCSWSSSWWQDQIAYFEVFVMTPDILFNSLHHCFMTMAMIALLVFDECHHAQKEHPYAKIMRSFYHEKGPLLPKIFGLTASPLKRKVTGQEVEKKIDVDIQKLEAMLDSKVYTLQDRSKVEDLLPNPKQYICQYSRNRERDAVQRLYSVLLGLRNKHANLLRNEETEFESSFKKGLEEIRKVHENTTYCLDRLGLWCAVQAAKAHLKKRGQILRDDADLERSRDLFVNEVLCVLKEADSTDGSQGCWLKVSGCDQCDIDRSLVSSKLLRLVDVINEYRDKYTRCIVFVERVVETYAVSGFLNHLKSLPFIRSLPLAGGQHMSQKLQQQTIEKFRAGEANLLVATDIAEEGLDIQSCSMVIRFDGAPKTTRSLIQSRGRARQKGSEYIMIVERENDGEQNDVQQLLREEQLLQKCTANRLGIPDLPNKVDGLEAEVYEVASTGARVTTDYSVPLLYRYCSTLPGDQFFQPKPDFTCYVDSLGIFCRVKLPSSSPLQVVSRPCGSEKLARRLAALEACKKLHEIGALNDYLLPVAEDEKLDGVDTPYQENMANDPMVQVELHAALTPEAFCGDWATASTSFCLFAFAFNIVAEPPDRDYADFGIFFSSDLDEYVTNVVTDLSLTRGRLLHLTLVPKGQIEFNVEQLRDAKQFQERLYGITLDHIYDHQDTRDLEVPSLPSWDPRRLFLTLPVLHSAENVITVDWAAVTMLLGGVTETFQIRPLTCHHAVGESSSEVVQPVHEVQDTARFFQMANALVPVDTVLNSLVVTIHNDTQYCVESVLWDMDCESPFGSSRVEYSSYVDYYKKRHKVDILKPKQRLLKAKRLMKMRNLLVKKPEKDSGSASKQELFVELPPELCDLKVLGLPSKVVNTMSLIPSFMQRLENLLLATQLKRKLERDYGQGAKVSPQMILAALTTLKCNENSNLERLELYGDSFLKFAVSKRLFLIHDDKYEGDLTVLRQNVISNPALHQRGVAKKLTLYIHDEKFDPLYWSAPGRPGQVQCHSENYSSLHPKSSGTSSSSNQMKCSEGHRWLQKKTIADVVEGLIGAHLVDGGPEAALAFMNWAGIDVYFDDCLIAASNSCCCVGDINDIRGKDLSQLESILQYSFVNKSLLVEAITHGSYQRSYRRGYQRLEFLGDAVLDYLITRYLYATFPDLPPGDLTDLRSATASNECFARVAVRFGLQEFLLHRSDALARDVKKFVLYMEDVANGENFYSWECDKPGPKVLSDMVESLAGAIFVDTQFDTGKVWAVFERLLQPIVTKETLTLHPVRELEELCNKKKWYFKFDCSKHGELKVATCTVRVGTRQFETRGEKSSGKVAKRLAASEMLKKLKSLGFEHPYKALTAFLISKGELKSPPAASEGRRFGKMVNKVEFPDGETTPPTSLDSSEDDCSFTLDHGEGGILSAAATVEYSSVSEHNITKSEALRRNTEEGLQGELIRGASSEEPGCWDRMILAQAPVETAAGGRGNLTFSMEHLSPSASVEFESLPEALPVGTAATIVQAHYENALGTSELDVLAVRLSNSLAELTLSEVRNGGPCLQKEIPCNEDVNMSFVPRSEDRLQQETISYPSCKFDDSGMFATEGSASSATFCTTAQEDSANLASSLNTGFIQYASVFENHAKNIDVGNANSDDVQSLLDVLLRRKNIVPSHGVSISSSAGGRSNDDVYEAAAMPFGESIPAFPQSGASTHSPGWNDNLSGWFSQAKNFDENVGRPREDLHNMCAKYKWSMPKYEPLPGYPQGPAHASRFAYVCKLTCSVKQQGVTNDYEVDCDGDIMRDSRRAMDSAASYALDWLRNTFDPSHYAPTLCQPFVQAASAH